MQFTPFNKFPQNSFKLFDRGYRPLKPTIATSKVDWCGAAECGAAGKVRCGCIGALAEVLSCRTVPLAENGEPLLRRRALGTESALSRLGLCRGCGAASMLTDSTSASSCFF